MGFRQKNIFKFLRGLKPTPNSRWVITRSESAWNGRRYVSVNEEGYWYDGPWSLAHDVDAVYACEDYRWRNDDGSIIAATWVASENTAVTTNFSPGDNIRLRVNFGETAGAAGTGVDTGSWTLQFKKNTGSWTTIGAATDCQFFDSTNLVNGTVITVINHVLGWLGGGTAQAYGDENEDGVTPSQAWEKDFAEAEFSLKFHDTNSAAGDQFTFRLLGPDASVVTFVNVPTIDLVAGGGVDLDLTATFVNVAIADVNAVINATLNLTATLKNVAVADVDTILGLQRDLIATLVNVVVVDVDTVLNLSRILTPAVVDIVVADLNAVVGLGGDLDLTATQVDIVVNDLASTLNLSRELSASLVSIAIADLNSTVSFNRSLTATLVNVNVADLNATVELVGLAAAFINIAQECARAIARKIAFEPTVTRKDK